jgi:hypothetical protein
VDLGNPEMARTALRAAVRAALHSLQGSSFVGLDVSLSRTGICVLDAAGALSRLEVVGPPRGSPRGSLLCAAGAVAASLRVACVAHRPIAAVCVEDFVLSFSANASSSHTRFALARINGVAAFEAWRVACAPVLFSSPVSMRAYFGVARPGGGPAVAGGDAAAGARRRRASGIAGKAAVAAFVARQFPLEPRLRAGGDAADATLAAMHALAKEVEWRALTGAGCGDGGGVGSSAAFVALAGELAAAQRLTPARVSALIPHWGGAACKEVGGQQLAVREVLLGLHALHARAVAEEAGDRSLWPGDGMAVGNDGGGGGGVCDADAPPPPPPPPPRKGARKRAAKSAVQAGAAAQTPAMERLYARLRVTFAAQVREALTAPEQGLLGWRLDEKVKAL